MTKSSDDNLIFKSVTVGCDPATAFHIWTEKISVWWPREHSISGHPQAEVFLEGVVGGRLYEQTPDGSAHVWGAVLSWDPPNAFAYHWYLGSQPSRPTRVEVRFTAVGPEQTRVDVTHHGPELIGPLWFSRKSSFNSAWDHLLPSFVSACK